MSFEVFVKAWDYFSGNVLSFVYFLIVLATIYLFKYMLRNRIKHKELDFSREKEDFGKLKELGALDWSNINEGKSLFIQSILKDRFGRDLTINEFIALSRFPNTIEVIEVYLKHKSYYKIQNDGSISLDSDRTKKSVGIYARNWELFFGSVASFVFSSVLFSLGIAFWTSSNNILLNSAFGIAFFLMSAVFYGMTLYIATRIGEPSTAIRNSKVFECGDLLTFPLELHETKLIHIEPSNR